MFGWCSREVGVQYTNQIDPDLRDKAQSSNDTRSCASLAQGVRETVRRDRRATGPAPQVDPAANGGVPMGGVGGEPGRGPIAGDRTGPGWCALVNDR